MYTEKHVRRVRYPLGVVALVLAALALRALGDWIIRARVTSGSSAWVPTFGSTLGETIVVYSLLVNVFTLIVVPAVAFWLGREYGRAERWAVARGVTNKDS